MYAAAFVVDLRKVPIGDIPADGNGSYNSTTKKAKYGDDGELTLVRRYSTSKESGDFSRMIAHLIDRDGLIVRNRALLQYRFEGEEHHVPVRPHGNAKSSNRPYSMTKLSVKDKLVSSMQGISTQEAIFKLTKDEGGVETNAADVPTGRNQGYYLNKKNKCKLRADEHIPEKGKEWDSILDLAKSDLKDFVQDIKSHPPVLIIATDQQLDDMEFLTTREYVSTPVQIDPTFKNGPFNLTPISYQNIALQSKQTHQAPYMVGPMLVHFDKSYRSYHYFATTLLGLRPGLARMTSFGTDGEEALYTAFERSFSSSLHLRCFRHFRQNVEKKLNSLNLKPVGPFLNEIFGVQKGDLYVEGILDCFDEDVFDASLESLSTVWNEG
jgi:hypothetical protein